MSAGIKSFFSKFNIVHEVAAPYHPESNSMAERLVRLLKDKLHHVKKDQGFNLQRSLNIAVSAYCMVPHRATVFSPFVLLYGCEAVTPYEILITSMGWRNSAKMPLVLTSTKMFEIHQRAFLSNRRY